MSVAYIDPFSEVQKPDGPQKTFFLNYFTALQRILVLPRIFKIDYTVKTALV